MLQDALNILRSQFLGLSRVLSTVTELINTGIEYDDDRELLQAAASLLINNHNFQVCSVHIVTDGTLQEVCSVSADALFPKPDASHQKHWREACEHLAGYLLQHPSENQIVRQQDGEAVFYAMPLNYRGGLLATVTLHAPNFDDNHPKLITVFCSILTSVLINTRHSQHLNHEVQRRTEELETAWKQADSSSRAKSQFLTNMSHEYLTPLNVIAGSAILMNDTPLNDEQRGLMDTIAQSADGIKVMVNETLDYSLTEAGDVALNNAMTDLRALAQRVLTHYARPAQQKSLQMQLQLCEALPARVLVDGEKLEQILSHLVSNAVKFTEQGSIKIGIDAESRSASHVRIRVSVSDTGIGLQQADIETVFEAFHQVDNSDMRKFGGTGLGLAISQNKARLLGSRIEVESEPAQGSCFSMILSLPFEETDEPKPEPQKQQLSTRNPEHPLSVLLVEDNLVNQKVAARLLEKLGCQVDIAQDGAVAVDMFTASRYDLVFMDCQMPNMDGFEATSRIRALETERHTPIIALTANSLPEDRARSFKVGMDEFISKPIARQKLQEALTRWAAAC